MYRFVGWFTDEKCTQSVVAGWVDADGKFVPEKTLTYGETVGYAAATYYAKFELNEVDLTIIKEGAESIDSDQTFLFNVVGTSDATKHISLTVAIVGNGSTKITGLPVGQYTITEDAGWSWRYSANSASVELNENKSVTITNKRNIVKWLDSNFNVANRFNKITTE